MKPLYEPPFILIAGVARSGTSALRSLVAGHPNAAVLLEDQATTILQMFQTLASVRVEAEHAEVAAALGSGLSFIGEPYERVREQLAALSELPGYRRRFSRLLGGFFAEACKRTTVSVIGTKKPIGPRWEDLPYLRSVLGDLRLLLILRNPVDVVSSSLRRRDAAAQGQDVWHVSSVEDAVSEWLYGMRVMAEAAVSSKRVLVIKYEDLCADPAVVEQVLGFAGLEPYPGQPPLVGGDPVRGRSTLTEAEAAYLRMQVGEVEALWARRTSDELLAYVRELSPWYELGAFVALHSGSADQLLLSGFSYPEPWGRWTDGDVARLRLRCQQVESDLRLHLTPAMVRPAPGRTGAPVDIVVNGASLGSLEVQPGVEAEAPIPRHALRPDGVLSVDINIHGPKPPDEEPVVDRRALGLGLVGFRISQA